MLDTTTLLRDLVAINSINPDLVADGPGEREIAHFVAQWLRRAGLEVSWEEPAPGRPNVIGVLRGSGGGRSLLLNAHMDTVGVAGMDRPFEPHIEGNRLYGRGAFDMKGGLAACMVALAQATQFSLRGDVILTAVADEEYASIGSQAIADTWHADAAIVTEPSDLQLCIAHKGFQWLEITTQGEAAHGSRPDLGHDAILKMGHVLLGLENLERRVHSSSSHPLLGSGSLHTSLVEGGQELSSYPAHCTLQLERRTLPGETVPVVEAEIEEILARIQHDDPTFLARFKTTFVRDPFEAAPDTPIVQTLSQQVTSHLGVRPEMVGAPWWTDAALFAAAGIPTVIFGPGGAGAHAVVEWGDLTQVQRCSEVLLSTMQTFCA